MSLVTLDPHIQRLFVEQDPNIGALGRLAALERLALRQRSYRRSPSPVRFVEPSIDMDRSGRPLRDGNRRVAADAVRLLGGTGRAAQPSERGEDRYKAHATDFERHLRGQRAS